MERDLYLFRMEKMWNMGEIGEIGEIGKIGENGEYGEISEKWGRLGLTNAGSKLKLKKKLGGT